VPTFPDATQILLAGSSAGGVGVQQNEELFQKAFGSIPVAMLDDSGPAMSSAYVPTCLQDLWNKTWGFDDSFLADCGSDCPDHQNYLVDSAKHLAKVSQGHRAGLVETVDDQTMTKFYGYGLNTCTGSFATPVPAATFQAGLLDFRTQMQPFAADYGTYYAPGTQHQWLIFDSFYTQTVGGVRLVDWVKGIINGDPAQQVGP
jgi:hypothetical protein